MYCALDKIDLAATVDGQEVALQTDHRSAEEIERELELSVLFAMTRAINARSEVAQVHYVVAGPPAQLVEALHAAGAAISETTTRLTKRDIPAASEVLAGELADDNFRALARRVTSRLGTRDHAIALRMLEDQTLADPPTRDDAAGYWRRVLELAALTGELLRQKLGGRGRWVQTDRALVPFGFEITSAAGATVLFPTNRAQRVIEDGRDESLFKLLIAAEETLQQPPDLATGRLMPSLRDRRNVELDEVVWTPLLPEAAPSVELPVVVYGIDGESTFGMIRREAIDERHDALGEALANLESETIEINEHSVTDLKLLSLTGSFYAAEKVLDRALMRELHTELGAATLLAAAPARGVLLISSAGDGATRFAALVRARFDDAGGRAISPAVLILEDGQVTGCIHDTAFHRADTGRVRSDTSPDHPGDKTGLLRRVLNRK